MYDIGEMVEIILKESDDFLKVKETLTRIGVASRKEKTLYQSCHILHKQSKYYLSLSWQPHRKVFSLPQDFFSYTHRALHQKR